MNTRDIEAAAEKWNNTLERLHNDPQPERPEPEPDHIAGPGFNALLEENKDLRALVELLKVECAFLHTCVKQRDTRIKQLEIRNEQ